MREPSYKWWEKPEPLKFGYYILHLIVDCKIPQDEAVPLAARNFNLDMPDEIDQLLEQAK